MSKDICLRGTAFDGQVRFFIATTRNLTEEARKRHGLSNLATAALGRTLTAAAMMGMTLKGKDTLTVTFKGDGPLGTVLARAGADGVVKGYVDHPEAELPLKESGKLDVASGIGFGMLYVTKDLGMREPYTGSVPIVSGEIGEDLTEYYFSSEQTLSAVGLGVLVDVDYTVKSAGGFILQLMPGAEERIGILLDEKVQELPPLSAWFADHGPEELAERFFGEEYRLLGEQELAFRCACSKENFSISLASLGREELERLAEDEDIEVVCQFCNEKYLFDRAELKALIETLGPFGATQ